MTDNEHLKELEAKYRPYDKYNVGRVLPYSYWGDWQRKPKFGEWMLFKHWRGEDNMISKPILALTLGHTLWDQALVLEYVEEWRGFHINQMKFVPDKEVKHVQLWTDEIIVLGQWEQKPSFSELRKALK